MDKITSKNNPLIKFAVSLKQKKYRDEYGLCLIEGIKILKEAEKNDFKTETVFVTGSVFQFIENENIDANIVLVSDEIIKYLSSVPSPQGLVAVVHTKYFDFDLPDKNFLLLDNIQDPSNLGAIVRTAVATDFVNIYMINCCDPFSDKVIRSSMGNLFKCKFINTDYSEIDCLSQYLYVADMKGENIFSQKNFKEIVGLCIGNEGHGVSSEIREKSQSLFSIPMLNDVESLNASVSAGIIMYHIKTNQKEKLS